MTNASYAVDRELRITLFEEINLTRSNETHFAGQGEIVAQDVNRCRCKCANANAQVPFGYAYRSSGKFA